MNISNNTLARDFTLKFLFHLRLDARPELMEKLKSSHPPLSSLEQEWNDFNTSYTETDIEHPDNQLPKGAYNYAKNIINNVLGQYEDLKLLISPYLKKRALDKIDQMDFWILMMASAEFSLEGKAPNKVIINEAIELAKKYGDNDSYSFINGVLDALSKEKFS